MRVSGVCCAHALHVCIPLCDSLLQQFWAVRVLQQEACSSGFPVPLLAALYCGVGYIPKIEKRKAIFVARLLPALALVPCSRGVLSCGRPSGFFDRACCALLITSADLLACRVWVPSIAASRLASCCAVCYAVL